MLKETPESGTAKVEKRGSARSVAECDPARMEKHWRVLCKKIGERRAGTPGEKAAADYITAEFKRLEISDAHQENFPCTSLRDSRVGLAVRTRTGWKSSHARAIVGDS